MNIHSLFAKMLAGCGLMFCMQASAIEQCKSICVNSWGYHLILDCKACDIDKVTDPDYLAYFVKEVIKAIDMKAYGEPTIVHFAEHNPDAAGYSLLQLIETSTITGHFVDKNGDAYIDIFSCKNFDPQAAAQIVQNLLGAQNIKTRFFIRQA